MRRYVANLLPPPLRWFWRLKTQFFNMGGNSTKDKKADPKPQTTDKKVVTKTTTTEEQHHKKPEKTGDAK